MATGDLAPAQITKLIISTGVKDNFVTALVEEALVAKPTLEVAIAQDSTFISTSDAPVVTSEIRQIIVQLAPIFLGGTSVPLPSSKSALAVIVEKGSASALARPGLGVNILEGLITYVINQFLSMMKYSTKLVFFGHSCFEFVQLLLENHIENIRKVGGFDRDKVNQACI